MHLITAGTPEQFQGLFQPALTLSGRFQRGSGGGFVASPQTRQEITVLLSQPEIPGRPTSPRPLIGASVNPVIRGAACVGC